MDSQTFYEKYPDGLMTPTHRPDTGCSKCLKGRYCYEHDYRVVTDMLLTLWQDMIWLMSSVPCMETHGYIRRYQWLLNHLSEIQERRKPQKLTSASIAGTRRFVVA